MSIKKIVIFGASGTLGTACSTELSSSGYEVIPVGHDLTVLEGIEQVDGAVWAQGANFTGDLTQTTSETWDAIWDANFQFIVRSLEILLEKKSFNRGSRLVVMSSVWQEISRPQKVAYIASKAAVGGLVRGLAADLGKDGISINAVLPGVVDSPMTHKHLNSAQISRIIEGTPTGALVTPAQIAKTVAFLIGPDSAGINGQSIIVDGGWSITRNV
ncbi:MAG: SDR family oxidoreductase [Candidatus Nanopelagicaceae bacterium]|nr:SDR family oxidoreductase [Candidatus Nanopelagicaceae bacterium]